MIQSKMNGFEIYEFHPDYKNTNEHALFFAHANGIPAQTYKSLLKKMANELSNQRIVDLLYI